jgi:hypothetical protein
MGGGRKLKCRTADACYSGYSGLKYQLYTAHGCGIIGRQSWKKLKIGIVNGLQNIK